MVPPQQQMTIVWGNTPLEKIRKKYLKNFIESGSRIVLKMKIYNLSCNNFVLEKISYELYILCLFQRLSNYFASHVENTTWSQ